MSRTIHSFSPLLLIWVWMCVVHTYAINKWKNDYCMCAFCRRGWKPLHPHNLVDGVSENYVLVASSSLTVALIHADKIDVESIIYSSLLFFSLFLSPSLSISLFPILCLFFCLFIAFICTAMPSCILADIIQFLIRLALSSLLWYFSCFCLSVPFIWFLTTLTLSVCFGLLDLRKTYPDSWFVISSFCCLSRLFFFFKHIANVCYFLFRFILISPF